jgi:hypothetical protein
MENTEKILIGIAGLGVLALLFGKSNSTQSASARPCGGCQKKS